MNAQAGGTGKIAERRTKGGKRAQIQKPGKIARVRATMKKSAENRASASNNEKTLENRAGESNNEKERKCVSKRKRKRTIEAQTYKKTKAKNMVNG